MYSRSLQLEGFGNFVALRDLQETYGHARQRVPHRPGVYAVTRGDEIVYFGECADLRKRIALLVRFGLGTTSLHKGGSRLWDLPDPWDMQLGYREELSKHAAVAAETDLLTRFKEAHGRLPHANRKCGSVRAT